MAINPKDEKDLRSLYQEMNIGFAAPQNGGIAKPGSVMVLGMGETPDDPNSEDDDGVNELDVPQMLTAVIENLNHLKMDVDQGCQGDAQIEELQKCVDMLNSAIEEIGNNASGKDQNAAYTGVGGDKMDDQGDNAGQMDLQSMSSLPS
jgi:hypothetical protein